MKKMDERFRKITKIGLKKSYFEDNYHRFLTMSWTQFLLVYIGSFLVFNLFFGFLYWLVPDSVSGSNGEFFRDFSFSVQTFSTIGYGVYAPVTVYGHALVIIESLIAVLAIAFLTGLAFAKLSRPVARIQFTDRALIQKFNGKPTLIFRLANLRGNQIAEAVVRAVVLKTEISSEGQRMRVQHDVQFKRSSSSFFILTWSVMHVIDESSPFFGLTHQDLVDQNIEMSVSVMGYDESFSQTVHASCIYSPEDFVFDQQFSDMFMNSPQGGVFAIDYTKFNSLT